MRIWLRSVTNRATNGRGTSGPVNSTVPTTVPKVPVGPVTTRGVRPKPTTVDRTPSWRPCWNASRPWRAFRPITTRTCNSSITTWDNFTNNITITSPTRPIDPVVHGSLPSFCTFRTLRLGGVRPSPPSRTTSPLSPDGAGLCCGPASSIPTRLVRTDGPNMKPCPCTRDASLPPTPGYISTITSNPNGRDVTDDTRHDIHNLQHNRQHNYLWPQTRKQMSDHGCKWNRTLPISLQFETKVYTWEGNANAMQCANPVCQLETRTHKTRILGSLCTLHCHGVLTLNKLLPIVASYHTHTRMRKYIYMTGQTFVSAHTQL